MATMFVTSIYYIEGTCSLIISSICLFFLGPQGPERWVESTTQLKTPRGRMTLNNDKSCFGLDLPRAEGRPGCA